MIDRLELTCSTHLHCRAASQGADQSCFSCVPLMAMDPQGDYVVVASTASSTSPTSSSSSAANSFPILVISIVGILTTSVLLLGYYVFVIKCCLNRQRFDDVIGRLTSRSRRRWNVPLNAGFTDGRRGLDESTIRAIPTFRYRGKGSQVPHSFNECAVCLNEFQQDERIRLLPNCRHVFHIDCIDAWLQTSANCPLCRSTVTVAAPIAPADHELLPVEVLPQQEPRQMSGEVVIRVRDDDGASDQTPIPVADSGAINPSPRKAEQRLGREKGWKLRHVGSMGDECIDVRVDDEQFHRVQPMRRSFSMDSSSDRGLYMAVQKVLQQNPHFHEVVLAGESSSSSNSSRIRRSFFSFGRSSRSAVLLLQSQL